jgi:hypothetical protein
MIDEKILLVEKLKDNAVEFLGEKMIEDMGPVYKEQQKIIEQKLIDWVTWARQYYSTTEIKRAYSILLKEHGSIFTIVSPGTYAQIEAMDEWLDLSSNDVLFSSKFARQSAGLGKSITNPLHNKKTNTKTNSQKHYKKPMTLRQIIKTLHNPQICMRKLKRKEARLKKKGIRLFDSP